MDPIIFIWGTASRAAQVGCVPPLVCGRKRGPPRRSRLEPSRSRLDRDKYLTAAFNWKLECRSLPSSRLIFCSPDIILYGSAG
jgi:hypothetical protein